MVPDQRYIVIDAWLSRCLGKKSCRLNLTELSSKSDRDELHREIGELKQEPVFVYAKVPVDMLSATRFLEEVGFHLIDTNIVFDKSRSSDVPLKGTCTIRLAEPTDQDQVVDLARRSFCYSRFHLDCAISRDIADEIKAQWAKAYFLGERGNQMVVAQTGGEITGFLQLMTDKEHALVIDLIAVDDRFRGQGIGADMIRYAQQQNASCARVRVGTQLANAPSIRFYEKMGFRYLSSSYVFHFHTFPRG